MIFAYKIDGEASLKLFNFKIKHQLAQIQNYKSDNFKLYIWSQGLDKYDL